MKLVICLGNPGTDYEKSRHNFGFFFANFLKHEFGGKWNFNKKFNAEIAEISVAGERILLAKPQTFYNDSGFSARAIMDFYKIPRENLLVIHDEMDLPLGTIRTRTGGEAAGNNGVKSLISHLGTREFSRIRIGSGTPQNHDGSAKPPKSQHIKNVLGKITLEEQKILDAETAKIREIVENFARGDFEQTTYKS